MKLSTFLLLFAAASTAIAQSTASSQANLSPGQIGVAGDASSAATATVITLAGSSTTKDLKAAGDRVAQAGCPVVLTSAWLTPYLMLLRDGAAKPDDSGGIDLHFRNASGKAIRSMELDAVFLAKRTIYDLNGVKITLHLTATGTESIDNTFEHLRHLPLPAKTNPVLVDRMTLEQVTFADGSVWTSKDDGFCGIEPNSVEQIAK